MTFEVRFDRDVSNEVKQVAKRRLTAALDELASLDPNDPADVERTIHNMRKRCKEVRALARLVRTSIEHDFDEFNGSVRDAAAAVSALRDAQAILQTFEHLRAAHTGRHTVELDRVRAVLQSDADDATRQLRADDSALREAIRLLKGARRQASRWTISGGSDVLNVGIGLTFENGRRAMRRAERHPTDDHMHDWRKTVKHLWYDVRLLENSAPSMLGPLVNVLDGLAEALGDHNDLAVLAHLLENDPTKFGEPHDVTVVAAIAREQQAELARRALRLGATVYAERPNAFRRRLAEYWQLAVQLGPEEPTGGLAVIAVVNVDRSSAFVEAPTRERLDHTVELERKFLVDSLPESLTDGTLVRQGYIAHDDSVSVRVRQSTSGDGTRNTYTLTVKSGTGLVRTEIECKIGRQQFEAAWPLSEGRRVSKTRYRLPLDRHVIEFDVFHDALDGLLLAEVEFESEADMQAFEPPDWFGRDVSDNPAYSNASMATTPPT